MYRTEIILIEDDGNNIRTIKNHPIKAISGIRTITIIIQNDLTDTELIQDLPPCRLAFHPDDLISSIRNYLNGIGRGFMADTEFRCNRDVAMLLVNDLTELINASRT